MKGIDPEVKTSVSSKGSEEKGREVSCVGRRGGEGGGVESELDSDSDDEE